jgi:RNA polymerase sigma factor (sigma-70 family)
MSPSDSDLLHTFVANGSEAQSAFTTLVERHLNLVYSVARRHVRSSALAEEVAQSVFIDLARRAKQIPSDTPLVAWLHLVSHRTAVDVVRREARRTAREHAAAELSAMDTPSSNWKAVEPLLDEAVESLTPPDRTAILLRYFENKSLRDVGAALGTSDDAAQKRVSRALEQMRALFARRGVSASVSSLATSLAAHAIEIAPASLTTSFLAAPALSSIAGHTVVSGTQALVSGAGPKLAASLGAAALLGVAVWQTTTLFGQRQETAAVRSATAALENELTALRRMRAEAIGRQRIAQEEIARLAAMSPAVELDAEVEAWLARVARLRELAQQRPEQTLPEFSLLTEKDWFDAARDAAFETEEQRRDLLGKLRIQARWRTAPLLRQALQRYVDAHGGQLPEDLTHVLPFANSALSPAILERYEVLPRGKLTHVPPDDWLLEERTSFDEAQDSRLFVARWRSGVVPFSDVRTPDLRVALERYRAAHAGELPVTPAQLLAYFPRQPSAVALKTWLERSAEDFAAQMRELLPKG